MARPHVDIPYYIIGGVKDYAEKHDLSRDEAHAKLLREGLVADGIFDAETTHADDPDTPE